MKKILLGTVLALGVSVSAYASPITVQVGDNDGYGFGVADNGTAVWPGGGPSGSNYDGRSAGEASASNGAQFTDVYCALNPGCGPNAASAGDFIFPFAGVIDAGTITLDMGDFQSSTFGAFLASINGIAIGFSFDDGFQNTRVRTFVLTNAQVAAANTAHQVVLHLDRNGSNDFVAFDYAKLDANVVPEPASLLLVGSVLAGAAGLRRLRSRRTR